MSVNDKPELWKPHGTHPLVRRLVDSAPPNELESVILRSKDPNRCSKIFILLWITDLLDVKAGDRIIDFACGDYASLPNKHSLLKLKELEAFLRIENLRDLNASQLACEYLFREMSFQNRKEYFKRVLDISVTGNTLTVNTNYVLRFLGDVLRLDAEKFEDSCIESLGEKPPRPPDISSAEFWQNTEKKAVRAEGVVEDKKTGLRDLYSRLGLNNSASADSIQSAIAQSTDHTLQRDASAILLNPSIRESYDVVYGLLRHLGTLHARLGLGELNPTGNWPILRSDDFCYSEVPAAGRHASITSKPSWALAKWAAFKLWDALEPIFALFLLMLWAALVEQGDIPWQLALLSPILAFVFLHFYLKFKDMKIEKETHDLKLNIERKFHGRKTKIK